jgi:hypothetical protein
LPLFAFGVDAAPAVIAVLAGFMSMGLGVAGALWATVVQQRVPEELLSRVTAYDWLVSVGLNPLGMALGGPLAAWLGPRPTMIGMAVVVAVACLGILGLSDVRGMRRADDLVNEEAHA